MQKYKKRKRFQIIVHTILLKLFTLKLLFVFHIFFEIIAGGSDAAGVALGVARRADVSSVQNQPVMRRRDGLLRKMRRELLFNLERCVGVFDNAEPVRNTEHVRIDGHCGLVINDSQNNVGSFATNAGQTH